MGDFYSHLCDPHQASARFLPNEQTLDSLKDSHALAGSEVLTRVFLKGHFVKKKNVHPTT